MERKIGIFGRTLSIRIEFIKHETQTINDQTERSDTIPVSDHHEWHSDHVMFPHEVGDPREGPGQSVR